MVDICMEYRIIRGSLISQYLLEVSTVPDLDRNIRDAFPNTRKRQHVTHEVTVVSTEYIPYIGTKMLHVRTHTNSNGHEYHQAIQFNNVVFEKDDSPTNITIQDNTGVDFHIQPIKLNNINVKVRCNCLDFYYRFATWNFGDKSIVGPKPKPYIKTTNRPPVNPDQVPGFCKHLIRVVEDMEKEGLLYR